MSIISFLLITNLINFIFYYRYNANRLARIITEKSAEKLEEESKSKIKTFKYLPIGPAASFKGASKYHSELRNKYPSHLKITVFPQDLNFHAIEV